MRIEPGAISTMSVSHQPVTSSSVSVPLSFFLLIELPSFPFLQAHHAGEFRFPIVCSFEFRVFSSWTCGPGAEQVHESSHDESQQFPCGWVRGPQASTRHEDEGRARRVQWQRVRLTTIGFAYPAVMVASIRTRTHSCRPRTSPRTATTRQCRTLARLQPGSSSIRGTSSRRRSQFALLATKIWASG